MRDGDWNVVAGAFFPEWSSDRHIIMPRSLPDHWARFRSFDWGSARPFAVHWWAVSDGSVPDIARGCLVCYREWYGMKPNEPNVGLRMTAEQVAEGIRARERDDPKPASGMMVGVADPAIFAEDGGPSIASRMTQAARIVFRPADNKRVPQRGAMGGWDQVRARLVGDGDGNPMVVLFATCRDLIRTLPAMQHDDARPEDLATDGEDHAADSCFVAGTMIETARGAVPIEAMRVGTLVQTRLGLRPVCAVFSNGMRSIYRLPLSNGVILFGTANHPVWIDGKGFIPLAELRYGDMMRPWKTPVNTTVPRGRYGLASMVKSLHSTIFTTATAIRRTMIPRTWNVCLVGNTEANTGLNENPSNMFARSAGVGSRAYARGLPVFARMPVSRNGGETRALMSSSADAKAVAVCSSSIGSRLGSIVPVNVPTGSWRANMSGLSQRIGATIAALCSRPGTNARSGAVTVADEPTIVGRKRVYNLSVEGVEEYFANGILVSNCRYAMMSRPYVRDMERQKPRDSWDAAFNRDDNEVRDWRVA
jgi:hypothetical protein